jgi:hypothetical protein
MQTLFGSSAAGGLNRTKTITMKKKSDVESDDPLDREIDFSNARPNPFARDYYKSRNLRVLAPDLLEIFPDSQAVNEALRTLVRLTAPTPRKISARRVVAKKERG